MKSRPSVPEKTISGKDSLQLGKGGMDDPSGGLPPPRTRLLAKDSFDFCLKKCHPLGWILAQEIESLAQIGSFLVRPVTCIRMMAAQKTTFQGRQ